MFTGLIQKIGCVKRISRGNGLVLEIASEPWSPALLAGESIAVNGVCLTVAKFDATRFTADVLRETESRTGLGELIPGAKVNLERALRAGDALGGHLVQGHVDERGKIFAKEMKGRDFQLRIKCSRVFASHCVLKGSVAIDGVSLTISALGDDFFAVDLIPTTARETTLGAKKIGESVNLESDVIGKYASRKTEANEAPGGLREDQLLQAGFLD